MGKQKSYEVRNYLRRSIKFLLLSLPGIITGITLLRTTPVFAAHTLSIGSSTNVELALDADSTSLYKGTDNLTLSTSCPAGYSIQISSSDPYLRKDGTSTTDYFAPVSTSGAALTAGTWGYALTSSSTTYKGLSTSGVALASGTNTSVPVYYAALDNNLPSGEYKSGTVTYTTAVDDSCLTYTITWNANGGSSTTTSTVEVGSALDKLAAEPTRSGYTFLGWYTAASGGTRIGLDANNGVSMPTPTDDTTYYAHWLQNSTVTKTMQETNGSNCPTSAEWRKDTRDNSLYQVVKIGDLCVMATNLKITGTATSQNGGSYNFSAGDLTSGNSSTQARTHSLTTANQESFKNAYTSTEIGAWYNYCAASAGTVCSSSVKADATNSVCPTGWRLPTNSENSSIAPQKSLFQPVYGGYFYYSSLTSTGTSGLWWSSSQSTSNADFQYRLYYSGGVLNTNDNSKAIGFSVRCVAEAPKITWDANGGSSTSTETFTPGSALTKLAAEPTRSGYTFLGWYTAASGGTRVGLDSNNAVVMPTPTGNTTYYAHWLQNSTVTTMIQNTTAANCPTTATWRKDDRDNSLYQVVKIGSLCAMVTNLKITGTVKAQGGSNYNFSAGDLTAGNSYDQARTHLPTAANLEAFKNAYTSTEIGAWYNYCAASAGTVCNNTQTKDTTNSVCPSGWRLPTNSENSGFTSQKALYQPLYSGRFANSSLIDATTYGYWWSASQDYSNASRQYSLRYRSGSLNTYDNDKSNGFSVRCVAEAPKITWDANGGSSTTTETFTPGSALTKLAAEPTRSGYTFLGWYTAASGGTRVGLDENNAVVMPTPTGNTTYYAQWLQNSTVTTTIQNTTASNCPSTAAWRKDSRDSSLYQVVKIGSLCVMVTNLKITGSITTQTGGSYNVSAYDLTYGVGNSYDNARTHLPTAADLEEFKNAYTSTEIGAWYNYCAASAGSVCSGSTKADATNSVCPSGWRLPTDSENSGTLKSNKALFQPLYSGGFRSGSLNYATTDGLWWSATGDSSSNYQYYLYYYKGSLYTSYINKFNGHSVRCMRS